MQFYKLFRLLSHVSFLFKFLFWIDGVAALGDQHPVLR